MIEGGGLGRFPPKEVGPVDVHKENGVVDIVVKDEAAAVITAKKYISYFQGPLEKWKCNDQVVLRDLIPTDRKYAYDIRKVIDALADTDSVMELRKDFGRRMHRAVDLSLRA